MTNQDKRNKLEAKGYTITANIGYKNDVQTIVSYTLKDKQGRKLKTESSLTKLLR